jgi:hypothetical protein
VLLSKVCENKKHNQVLLSLKGLWEMMFLCSDFFFNICKRPAAKELRIKDILRYFSDRQSDCQVGWQTDRKADRQADRQTERQAGRQADKADVYIYLWFFVSFVLFDFLAVNLCTQLRLGQPWPDNTKTNLTTDNKHCSKISPKKKMEWCL